MATPDSTLQTRSMRATSWSPQVYSRPWRSSPLAGPAFSTLPPIISESSEDSHEKDVSPPESVRAFGQTRSLSESSIVSDSRPPSVSACASAYGSRNASGLTFPGQASTSSISLPASSSVHGTGPASSQGHGNSQTHSTRLSKPRAGRCTSPVQSDVHSGNASQVSVPPRARTVSHGHSRPTSFPTQSVPPSPSIPQTYSRASPRPTMSESETTMTKPPPSNSRDPDSNWMSSSPFGPASAPKFSRLAMASPAVVMPLSAREYRKRKAKTRGKGKEKEPAVPSNNVTDKVLSATQSSNGVPVVKVSPPPSEDVHQPRLVSSPSGDHAPTPPQPPADKPPKPLPQASFPVHPTATKSKRPHTPPRSSPLATHPPISPKSSAATFYSVTSALDDDAPAHPFHPQAVDDSSAINTEPIAVRRVARPRRRKSVPERLSNGARLSLIEAMNRLSQETANLHRLSVASQASGHTLFYDAELEENGQVASGHGNAEGDGDDEGDEQGGRCTPVLHTQSLEDLSSTLARTGIEVVHPDGDDTLEPPLDDERKAKRNVRVVRISDTVEVSPAPVHRRRKLTKSRPAPVREVAPTSEAGVADPETETNQETKVQVQTPERRSLLPWKSRGSSDGKSGARSGTPVGEKSVDAPASILVNGFVDLGDKTALTPFPRAPASSENGQPLASSNDTPATKSSSDIPSSTAPTPPRQPRRYTFSFFSSVALQRPKHEKATTAPAAFDLSPDKSAKSKPKESLKSAGSGTDSTSTSIRTITQGSQSTLTPATYDLTASASPSAPSEAGRSKGSSSVPMLRRVNAQAMGMGIPTEGVPLQQNDWDGKSGSTPSLITNGSTATSSDAPRTSTLPSFLRLSLSDGIGDPFLSRPSGLKASFTDASEDDSDGVHGGDKTANARAHRKQDPSPLTRSPIAIADIPEENEQTHLVVRSVSGLSLGQNQAQSPRSASRPGTSSSTLTTATDTSGSYISFSTLPASTATSTTSTSRSTSPLPTVGSEKRDADVHAMAPLPPGAMHPMFTVPLVTIPASAMSFSRSMFDEDGRGSGAGTGFAKYVGGRKSERHGSVPMIPAGAVGASTLPTWMDPHYYHDQNHVYAPGAMATALSPPPPSRAKKSRRPQTAPAGASDAAFKFFEDTKALSPYETTGARLTKGKHGSGESRFKTILRGLLRRGG